MHDFDLVERGVLGEYELSIHAAAVIHKGDYSIIMERCLDELTLSRIEPPGIKFYRLHSNVLSLLE
jgi:hypothetical protein